MFKRLVTCALTIVIAASTLTGCNSIFRKKIDVDPSILSTNDSNALYSGQYYVWHDDKQVNIANDINVSQSKFKNYKYKIFTPVYSRTIPHGVDTVGSSKRIFWLPAANDQYIPTLYEGDELIYFSSSTVPTEFTLERFYDLGYTLGFYGLKENINTSEHFYLDAKDNVGVLSSSSAKPILDFLQANEGAKMFIDSVGDKRITYEEISRSGTIKSLLANSTYNVIMYSGTKRYPLKMTADTRMFSSYEEAISIYSYDFVGNGIIKINLPDYLKTGYYNINGIGLFRYVKGDSYNSNTDFNDPIILKDDAGQIISNPIADAKKAVNESDRTLTNVDTINGTGNVTALNETITIEDNEKINFKLTYKLSPSATSYSKIKINFYMSDATSIYSQGTLGTRDNPFIFNPTDLELKAGYIEREISNLKAGTWIFTVTGLENYINHSLNVTSSSTKEDAQIGDFESETKKEQK